MNSASATVSRKKFVETFTQYVKNVLLTQLPEKADEYVMMEQAKQIIYKRINHIESAMRPERRKEVRL